MRELQIPPPNTHTLLGTGRFSAFFFTPFHPGSIRCLARACCSHVTLTDSRMNDLFGVWGGRWRWWCGGEVAFFNCQRWMASIGVLSLLMNQAICRFKQIHPRAVVQACCSERTPGTAAVCLEGGWKEKQVRKGVGGELNSRRKGAYCGIKPRALLCSPSVSLISLCKYERGRINTSFSLPHSLCGLDVHGEAEDCGSGIWAQRASAATLQV